MMTRRQAIKTTAFAAAVAATAPRALGEELKLSQPLISNQSSTGPFTLPPLPYAFDALEPHIDAQTMQIHHDKHHATYVANLNKAIAQHPELGTNSVDSLLKALVAVARSLRVATLLRLRRAG